jgi:hypothetical protein
MSDDMAAELAELRLRFPAFGIVRQALPGRRARYIARRTQDDVHPCTVVTADLAELHDELARATRTQPRPSRGR